MTKYTRGNLFNPFSITVTGTEIYASHLQVVLFPNEFAFGTSSHTSRNHGGGIDIHKESSQQCVFPAVIRLKVNKNKVDTMPRSIMTALRSTTVVPLRIMNH